jgi:hypothetical protein
MALLDSLYGETPSYFGGLLGEDELKRLQGQAQSQSNLGMAAALLRAGAPSRTPGGGALAIAEGLQMGQQAYKQALNQGLQEKMQGLQVQELMRKQQEAQAVRQFLPQLMQPGQMTQTAPAQLTMRGQPTMGVVRDDEGNMLPGGAEIPAQFATGPSTINREALQRLALAAPDQFAKYASGLKALQPEYKFEGGIAYQIDPFGGGIKQVGGMAKEDLAGPVKQAMQVLGIMKPFAEVTPQERAKIGEYIDRQESFKQPKVNVDLRDPTAVAKAQSDLLKDWRSVVKDSGATEVANRFRALSASMVEANKGNKQADGAIIYNIGKIYDPSGAVQEGDKNTILGNPSIPQQVKLYAQRVFEGGTLLPEQRNGLFAVTNAMVKERQKQLEADRQNYVKLSTQLGGTGDFIKDPYADVFSPRTPIDSSGQVDLMTLARQEQERRRKGQ